MPESFRPVPSAAEVEELAELYRESPRSTAFLPLADAYLQLMRPREALDVLLTGVTNHPDNADARLCLGRAYAMMHQWMEAQAELLRAVKLDRQNREAFRLLGEVLMRCSDYERALQVLQHAHNLNPADAQVLLMLKRAREGRPLDPPPAVPRGAAAPAAAPVRAPAPAQASGPIKRPAAPSFDAEPTKVAGQQHVKVPPSRPPLPKASIAPVLPKAAGTPPRPSAAPLAPLAPPPQVAPSIAMREDPTEISAEEPTHAALGRVSLERQQQKATVQERVIRRPGDAREGEAPQKKLGPKAPPEDPFKPLTAKPVQRLVTEDLEMSIEEMDVDDQETGEPAPAFGLRADPPRPEVQRPAERPRFQHAPNKQPGEGHEAARRSAAVGEDYLNELLVGGLLEVPNVEARPAIQDDGVPGKRWGRSRLPIFLLIWIVTLGGVGALAWYVVIPYIKQKNEYKVSDELKAQIARGRLEDYVAAQEELGKALRKSASNPLAAAYACEVQAMAHLVYGAGKREDMDASIAAAADLFKDRKPGAPGQHELAVARAAQAVAAALRAPDTVPALIAAQKEIERAKTIGTDDGTLLWLEGVVKLELGDRDGARTAFEQATAEGRGPPMAFISLGDMWLDEGNVKGALAAYESVMTLAPNHPYAVLGRALVKIEQQGDADAAMQDLNVGLATATGTRLMAWKRLVLGIVYAKLEDYEKSKTELEGAAASGLTEPRFLSRIALARLDQGNVVEAVRLRTLVRTGGDKVKDPLSTLLGAELLLATGLPEDALAMIEGRTDARARIARGRALLDAGKPGDAEKEFAAVLAEAPDDLKANAFRELSRVGARSGHKEALEALQKLARQSVSTAPRAVLGEAYAILGRRDDARRELEASLEGNPLAYRARVRLAEVYLADGRAEEAEKALHAALDQAPGYLPAHAMLGRSLLTAGKVDEALDELKIVLDAGRATWADELAIAQALAQGEQEGQKDLAREALLRAKDKGAPAEELARVAAMIDEELAKEFAAPAPRRRRGR